MPHTALPAGHVAALKGTPHSCPPAGPTSSPVEHSPVTLVAAVSSPLVPWYGWISMRTPVSGPASHSVGGSQSPQTMKRLPSVVSGTFGEMVDVRVRFQSPHSSLTQLRPVSSASLP